MVIGRLLVRLSMVTGQWSLSVVLSTLYSVYNFYFWTRQLHSARNKVLHSPRPGFQQLDLRPKILQNSLKLIKDFNMSVHFDSAKSAVKDALNDESKPWYKFFSWAEAQTGVSRLNLFLGFSVFLILYLIIGYGTLLLSNLIGFLYPAYASIKAVESSGKDDDTKWLTYWVVFSFITLIEFPAAILLSWIPFYSLIKTIFFVWCFIPISNNGSVVVYYKFIRPYFLKHEGDIDQAVTDISKKATEVVTKKLVTEKLN